MVDKQLVFFLGSAAALFIATHFYFERQNKYYNSIIQDRIKQMPEGEEKEEFKRQANALGIPTDTK